MKKLVLLLSLLTLTAPARASNVQVYPCFSTTANLLSCLISNYSIVWPAHQGAANTALVNDGSGNLSWTAPDFFIGGGIVGGNVNSVLYVGVGPVLAQDTDFVFDGTNLGIGTAAPDAMLDVADKFKVDLNGNITKTHNVTTSWPSAQGGANTVLLNDGAGVFSWLPATDASTASTVVERDAAGSFSANVITASLNGNATNVTGVVTVPHGGTGAGSLTLDGVLYGNGVGVVQATAGPAQYQPLVGSAGGAPVFGQLDLGQTAAVTGILPVPSGGSGAATFTTDGVLYGNGAGVFLATAAPTQYQALVGDVSGVPTFGQIALDQAAAVTGTLPVTRGGTGDGTFTSNGVLYGNGTGALSVTAQGGAHTILTANAGVPSFSQNPIINTSATIGVDASQTGSLLLANGGGGGASTTVQNNGATTAYNFNLPTTAGTSGQVLTSGGGVAAPMTWTTSTTGTVTSVAFTAPGGIFSVTGSPITTSGTLAETVAGTSGGIPYFSTSSILSSSGVLTGNAVVIGGGAGTTPSVVTNNSSATNEFLTQSSSGTPLWATLVSGDIPNNAANTSGTASNVSGIVAPNHGGTGVANNASSTLTISGSFPTTLTVGGSTSVSLPASGTLATLAGSEVFTNKTLTSPTVTGESSTAIASLGLRDASAAFDVTLAANSSTTLTAGRTVTFDTQNVSKTVKVTPLSQFSTLADGSAGQALTTLGTNTGYSWTTLYSNPLTTLGDMPYENATPATTRLAGNTTTTKNFLTQTGNGTISAAPAWGTIIAADVPNLDASKITTGTLVTARGGTNQSSWTAGSVPYLSNSTTFSEDNSNFFWDGTNHRLGIGVTAPSEPLTVSGTTASNTTAGQIRIVAGSGTTDAGLEFRTSGDGTRRGSIISPGSGSTNGNGLNFNTLTTTPAMTINDNGLVTLGASGGSQINLTNGTMKYQPPDVGGIQSGIEFLDAGTGSGEGLWLQWSSTDYPKNARIAAQGDGVGGSILFQTNVTTTGNPTTQGSVDHSGIWAMPHYANGTATFVSGNGTISSVSDSRLKTTQPGKFPGLAEVKKLRPRFYKWKSEIEEKGDEDAERHLGFYAQEVGSVIPEALGTPGSDGYYGLYDRPMIAALVEAVKELSAQETALKAEFAAYKDNHP